jgi:hypothetical protein
VKRSPLPDIGPVSGSVRKRNRFGLGEGRPHNKKNALLRSKLR